MTINPRSKQARSPLALQIESLSALKYFSRDDGAECVDVFCRKCGEMYTEVYSEAIEGAVLNIEQVCISCDVSADDQAPRLTKAGLVAWAVNL